MYILNISSINVVVQVSFKTGDKAVGHSRSHPSPPSHFQEMPLFSLIHYSLSGETNTLTPKYRVEQVHWRHAHRGIYDSLLLHTICHHMLGIIQAVPQLVINRCDH